MKNIYCDVVFAIPVNDKYTYIVPENLSCKLKEGSLVSADLGRQKNKIGVVVSIKKDLDQNHDIKILPINDILSETNFFSLSQMNLADYISNRYLISLGELLNHFFPFEKIKLLKSNKISDYVESRNQVDSAETKFYFDLSLEEKFKKIKKVKRNECIVKFNSLEEKFLFYEYLIGNSIYYKNQILIVFAQRNVLEDFYSYFVEKNKLMSAFVYKYTGDVPLENRYQIWDGVRLGIVKVILSTRIGLFLNYKDLDTVVVDELGDAGHKNIVNPKYSTLEILKYIQNTKKIKIYYSFFVPLLELKYKLKSTIMFSDIKKSEICLTNKGEKLKNLILKELYRLKQCIVIYPLKGFTRYTSCKKCGKMFRCNNCGGLVGYNMQKSSLRCEICKMKFSEFKCPKCGSKKYETFGKGIQNIHTFLELQLPEAVIKRLDSDVPERTRNNIINDFNEKKIDVIISTQEILSYIYRINWESTSLVYFSNVDAMLYRASYLAYENVYKFIHTFEALLLQKNNPKIYLELHKKDENYKFLFYEYKKFYNAELKIREELSYPPFCILIKIFFYFKNENIIEKVRYIIDELKKIENIIVFDFDEINKKLEIFCVEFLIKVFDEGSIEKIIDVLKKYSSDKIRISIDYDPKEFK